MTRAFVTGIGGQDGSYLAERLLADGVEVHVARDGVGSRSVQNERIGLEKMERAGAVVTSVETALFELVGRAGTDEFKAVQRLILDYAPNPGAQAVQA